MNIIAKKGEMRSFCFTNEEFEEFGYLAMQSLQVCWGILPLVKEIPKGGQIEYQNKLKLIRSMCSRSWIIFYFLLKSFFHGSDAERASNIISETLIWAHDQLGIESMCAGDDGLGLFN
jgi:hypothetical protein